jgi:hypothetical protein
LLDKTIDDTANYPRVMARLANATILGGESGRVSEIERLIARHYDLEFRESLARANTTGAMLAQMTMGLYYGQVNHQLAFGLPFETEQMCKQIAHAGPFAAWCTRGRINLNESLKGRNMNNAVSAAG